MVTDKQLQANRENGRLGGVKTEEGKEVVKFNALQHGILRNTLTEYEKEFYLEIYADFVRQYEPATLFERILVERATIYYLKLFRVQKAEQEYMKATLNPRVVKTHGVPSAYDLGLLKDEVVNEGYVPQLTHEHIQKLSDVYSRYEITLENRLLKVIHELERLVAIRKGIRVPQATVNVIQMGSFGRNI